MPISFTASEKVEQFPPISMEKLHWYKFLFTSFIILLLSPLQLLSSSAFTTPNQYLINCGSKVTSEFGGKNFVGDENSGSSPSFSRGSRTDTDNNPTTNISLYRTARIFKRPSSYKFQIKENGTCLVRLHFYAFLSPNNLAAAQFNVSASGLSLLSNFSVQRSDEPVIKEFLIAVHGKEFRVCFTPCGDTSLAFVNALEVFLTPSSEPFIPDEASYLSPAAESHSRPVSKVLQTTHRINVGGDKIEYDPQGRNWKRDDAYLLDQNPMINTTFYADNLKYQDGNATIYIAPDLVYRTARFINSKSSHITWRFEVSKKATYLLRVHFCDIVSKSQNTLEFNFSIYSKFSMTINPYNITAQLAAPFCLDFLVDSDESGFMNISVASIPSYQLPICFLNGLEIMESIKVSELACPEDDPKNNHLFLVVGLTVGGVALFFILAMVLLALKCRKGTTLDGPHLNLGLKIPLTEIKRATNNFDKRKMIGAGGFGKVYRGTLRNGMEVAVKRGEPEHGQGFSEFQTEIIILSKIRHRHLVSLIGFCDERSEMILVYEFMENGTLRDHLYESNEKFKRSPKLDYLSWKQRLEICIGSAEGLHYLHSSSDGGIIHRDVKSTNILLDNHYVAKVADFGISRSGHLDQTYVSTDVKGSIGYLDPEYFGSQQLTKKSDVYSFGVVLLEVLCARPAINSSLPGEQANLAEWAMSLEKRGQLEKIIDPRIVNEINPSSLRKFGETVEKCLKELGADRPVMGDVLWDLKYALELQQTVNNTEPHEDSTTGASLQLPVVAIQRLLSHSFPIEKDDAIIAKDEGSDTTASEVFSQLRIDEPR